MTISNITARFVKLMHMVVMVCILYVAYISTSAAKELSSIVTGYFIWPSFEIPVCWENASAGLLKNRKSVQSVIADTWERNSKYRFVGWEQCNAGDKGIRISIVDERSKSHIGAQFGGVTKMSLDFVRSKSNQHCAANDKLLDWCIRRTAIHEFGHALGLMHEQYRMDAPDECVGQLANFGEDMDNYVEALAYASATGIYIGKWDRLSVMNYCNDLPPMSTLKLSSGDIAGLKKLESFTDGAERPSLIPTICATHAGLLVRLLGTTLSEYELIDIFGNTIYSARAESADAMAGSPISCDEVFSTPNSIGIRVGRDNDLFHGYGIERNSAGAVSGIRQIFYTPRNMGVLGVSVGNLNTSDSYTVQFGDRRQSLCWSNSDKSWSTVYRNVWTSGKWESCDGVMKDKAYDGLFAERRIK